MKKNEKNFVQNEADLENVAGGLGTDVEVEVGDVTATGYNKEESNKTTQTTTNEQTLKFGNVSGGITGFNVSNGQFGR